jgi:hypothetical protein
MVLAMFVGNEKDVHTDDEIRELVTLIWEWQWGVGRALLKQLGAITSREPRPSWQLSRTGANVQSPKRPAPNV